MFVIAGATGNTGSSVAATLLERKQPVRVIVRTAEKGAAWRAKGAEVAVASLTDSKALAKALAGAEGAYLLIPPNYTVADYLADRRQFVDTLANAVETSGLTHLVFLSSIGAHLPAGTGPILTNRYGEQRLGAAARDVTFLRASYFMENWVPVLGAAKAQGLLPSFIAPRHKMGMVSARDIGHTAAESLLDPARGRRIIELSGPEEYSPEDVAAAVSQHLHRTVTVQHLPLSAVVPTFTSFGFSDGAARLFEEMYAGLESGHIAFEGEGTTHLRGHVALPAALAHAIQA